MIRIDFHTHVSTGMMGPGFSPVREDGELTYIDGSKERVLQLLDEAKIDKAVALPFNPYQPHPKVKPLRYYGKEMKGYSDCTNEFVSGLVKEHPDRFVGFATVNPKDTGYSIPLLEYAVSELGLKGVKIYPGAWKFYPNDPDVFPVYRKAVELGIVIMFCTSIWSPFYGGSKYARPSYVDDVVRTFPDGKFVIAHFGALGVGQESLAVACGYENVYLDTAHAFTYPADFETAIAMVGPGRLIFGSDAPEWVSPAEQAKFVEETAAKVGLSKDEIDMIMGGNAAKLLDLD